MMSPCIFMAAGGELAWTAHQPLNKTLREMVSQAVKPVLDEEDLALSF